MTLVKLFRMSFERRASVLYGNTPRSRYPSKIHPGFPPVPSRLHIMYDQPIKRVESPRMLYNNPQRKK